MNANRTPESTPAAIGADMPTGATATWLLRRAIRKKQPPARPTMWRAYDPLGIAREALRRGAMVPDRAGYRFGRRLYSRKIINELIAAGAARKLEDGRIISPAALPAPILIALICALIGI